jgi:hypothetical protein
MTAKDLISALGLEPHPEGGWYRETYRDAPGGEGRGALSLVYFLLLGGSPSAWHRLDAVESWHHYEGAPALLRIVASGGRPEEIRLGPDFARGERPQAIVPAGAWQCAETLGEFTLAGCATAPAFEFAGFELAPPDFDPRGPKP